ncbi:phosphate ABC transporter permease subunit PstC [Treponema brennaborense]|uniref:phosphate ABC transporter permease subunit PstC n=1 Tax=Treponema brennaborense TaxID=81028 RepID=UPI00031A0EF6|nr:phosphate ABC transporter permease subunit PstC [Treponema brennaborense]
MEKTFLVCALISISSVILMSVFIFRQGLPLFASVSPADFLFSTDWAPTRDPDPGFGILSFVAGSLYVTFLALLIAVPVGVSAGIFLSEMAGRRAGAFLRNAVELLAGIPSVIYGLFGISFIVPFVRNTFGGSGYSVLSAALILAIMTLPTIINMTEVSVRNVPNDLREGSYALGATKWQTIIGVLLPAARSGIVTGVVLGMGRAMGETMAVLLVGGNAPIMPDGLSSMVRTLTMNIITDMAYAEGTHLTSLFTTAIVLFVFILALNLIIQLVLKSSMKEQKGSL